MRAWEDPPGEPADPRQDGAPTRAAFVAVIAVAAAVLVVGWDLSVGTSPEVVDEGVEVERPASEETVQSEATDPEGDPRPPTAGEAPSVAAGETTIVSCHTTSPHLHRALASGDLPWADDGCRGDRLPIR